MTGLYWKAFMAQTDDSKKGSEEESTPQEDLVLDGESGISKEDQKEILQEIDKIAAESKIRITPEIFNIHAQKKGVLFPIVINLMAFGILAIGITVLAFFFKRGEEQLMEDTTARTSAEGKLLQELKKESEERLQAKNVEITQINARLGEIDRERQELQSNMDTKIQEREQELRDALQSELAVERARLQGEGVSEEDINARIGAMEGERTAEYNQRLEEFRSEAEAERVQIERNLENLQSEYNNILLQTRQEKENLQEDARKREQELQDELAEKEKALEASKSGVQQELAQLSQQLDNEKLVDSQIIGFYNSVKDNINKEDFSEALTDLASIRDYINEDTIVTLPSVQKRREVEFFVIDSLTQLVRNEMQKEVVDTSSLIDSANRLTELRDTVAEADNELLLGNTDRARILYEEAISALPEIEKSHQFFVDERNAAETLRIDTFRDYLSQAELAFDQKEYLKSLDQYAIAFEYLPE